MFHERGISSPFSFQQATPNQALLVAGGLPVSAFDSGFSIKQTSQQAPPKIVRILSQFKAKRTGMLQRLLCTQDQMRNLKKSNQICLAKATKQS